MSGSIFRAVLKTMNKNSEKFIINRKMNKKHILILRPDGIGDCVLFSGTLKYYRKLYPKAYITLSLRKNIISLFENCPYIDDLIDYKIFSYVKSNKIIEKILKRIRKLTLPIINKFKRKYDIIICPVRSITPEMLWIVKNYRSRKKIGIVGCPSNIPKDKQDFKKKVFTDYFPINEDKLWQHELKTNLEFLNFLGASLNNIEEIWPEFWIDDNYDVTIKTKDLLKKSNYTLLIPFSTVRNREIATEQYIEIIEKLIKTNKIVIVGVRKDFNRAEGIRKALKDTGKKSFNLCGYTTLSELIFLINNAESVISVNTAGLHIAISLHKPVYAIVGGGLFGRFFPWGNNENVHWLNKGMDCFQCNWKCKYGDFRCVKNIDYDNISTFKTKNVER